MRRTLELACILVVASLLALAGLDVEPVVTPVEVEAPWTIGLWNAEAARVYPAYEYSAAEYRGVTYAVTVGRPLDDPGHVPVRTAWRLVDGQWRLLSDSDHRSLPRALIAELARTRPVPLPEEHSASGP